MRHGYVLFLVLIIVSISAGLSAFSPVFGERPEIDLSKVPDEAMVENVFQVKFERKMTDHLDNNPIAHDEQGNILFGIEEIDRLNREYQVVGIRQIFNSPALSKEFEERHRSWGLHLWYELSFESDQDIRKIVKVYKKVSALEIVTPEFRKKLIGAEINQLSEVDFITDVSNSREWLPDDPLFENQWHFKNTGQQEGTPGSDIKLAEAWEIERGRQEVIVAVVDQGIDYGHPDLSANMWEEIGYNFVNNTPDVTVGIHGTHIAGTVGAVSNNGVGVAGIAGGTGSGDGVRLMSCQIFSDHQSGGAEVAYIFSADRGASISQNSWSYVNPDVYDHSVLVGIDYFNHFGGGDAMEGGITFFAIGNDNREANMYPGFYSGTISVAATNNQDQRAIYSNYGDWVDISAPGGETHEILERGILSTVWNESYSYFRGTSSACPHVSGVAALIVSLAYGEIRASDVKEMLLGSTDNHYDQNPDYIGKLGTGRLNAHNALLQALEYLDRPANPTEFAAQSLNQSEISLEWELNTDQDNVMIVWSEQDDFSIPEDGQSYSLNQILTQGERVLYLGNDAEYLHKYLNSSRRYYYRIWSFDENFRYSFGKTIASFTQGLIMVPPIEQNFEDPLIMGWSIVDNIDSGQTWQIGRLEDGLAGETGNYAFINSAAYGEEGFQESDLISARFDFSAFADIAVFFTHFYRDSANSTASFSYSLDDGDTWTDVQVWNSSTPNPSFFIRNIPEVSLQPNVLFRWNYTGNNAYHWCVDDVMVLGNQVESSQILIETEAVNFFVEDEATETELLTISNPGSVPLTYNLIVEEDGHSLASEDTGRQLSWLSVTPEVGFISPDSQSEIQVVIRSYGLSDGSYNARIIIQNNAGSPVTIPVTLYVGEHSNTDDVPEVLVTELINNYPNPFNPETKISFSLGMQGAVKIDVFNIAGQRVRNLIDEQRPIGHHTVIWDGRDYQGRAAASGIYFYRLTTDDTVQTRKMLLLK